MKKIKINQVEDTHSFFWKRLIKAVLIISFAINLIPLNMAQAQSSGITYEWQDFTDPVETGVVINWNYDFSTFSYTLTEDTLLLSSPIRSSTVTGKSVTLIVDPAKKYIFELTPWLSNGTKSIRTYDATINPRGQTPDPPPTDPTPTDPTPTDPPPTDPTPTDPLANTISDACITALNLMNNFSDTDKTISDSSIQADQDLAETALLCLNFDYNESKSLNENIKAFQTKEKLTVDGKIGIQTAFDLGYQVGLLEPNKNNSCLSLSVAFKDIAANPESVNQSFYPANTIPQTSTRFKEQYKKNMEMLDAVLKCTALIAADETIIDGDNLDFSVTDDDTLYGLQTASDKAAAGIMFYVGRKFGISNGNITLPDGSTNKKTPEATSTPNPIDKEPAAPVDDNGPCPERLRKYYDNQNETPNMSFDGQKISLVPEAPGTYNWKDATLEEFLGGGRNTDNAIYRYECLVGAGIFMSIIWKVVFIFESLLSVITVAMLLYGGYLYLTAAGDESLAEKGTKSITWSLIGVVVVLTSRLITDILIPRYNDSILYNTNELLTSNATDSGRSSLIGITNYILGFVAGIAVLMIIYGGYLYIIAHGDDSLEEKGKTVLIDAIIGLIIVIIAYTLVTAIFGAANVPVTG